MPTTAKARRSNRLLNAVESLENRLLFTAALDNTFGQGGISPFAPLGVPANTDIDGGGIAANSDGSAILVFGLDATDDQNQPGEIVLNRVTPSGALDSAFGTGGFLQFGQSPGSTEQFSGGGVFPLPNGQFILELSSVDSTATDPVPTGSVTAARYNSNGQLDSTYGNNGFLTLTGADGRDSQIDSSGRVLIPGTFLESGGVEQDGVIRLTQGGQLDTTYGSNGFASIPEPNTSNNDGVRSLAVAPDGSVYVIGRETFDEPNGPSLSNFYVDHLTNTGAVDPNFAGGSFRELAGGYTDDDAPPAVVQSDGRVVILASASDTQGLVRLNLDGSIDSTFQYAPLTSFDTKNDAAHLSLEADGKLIISGGAMLNGQVSTGGALQGGQDSFAVARLNSNGTADASFGNGLAEPGVDVLTQYDNAPLAAAYPDGRILAVGGDRGVKDMGVLVRFDGSFTPISTPVVQGPSLKVGGLDTTFGGTQGAAPGVAAVTLPNLKAVTAGIVTQSDGKLVVAATVTPTDNNGIPEGNSDFELFRLNTDGSLDTTFGNSGFARADFPTSASASSVQLLPDGRILVVGSASDAAGGTDFAFARFNSDGSLDTSLQGIGRGQVAIGSTPASDVARAVAISPDGTFYIAGSSGSDIAVAKFNTDGSLATSFNNGAALLDLGGTDVANAIVLQKDGKIVIAGSTGPAGGQTKFAIARFNANGTIDTQFGAVGKTHPGYVTVAIGHIDDEAYAAALQPDGSILAGGFTTIAGSTAGGTAVTSFALVRLTSAGKLDTKFGSGGKVTTSFSGDSLVSITTLAVQGTGSNLRILASGKAAPSLASLSDQSRAVALARYNFKGALDTSFGAGGKSILLQSNNLVPMVAFIATPADTLAQSFAAFAQDSQGAVALTATGGIRALASNNNPQSTSVFVAAIVPDGVDFIASFVKAKHPTSVMGGAKDSYTVVVTNAGSLPATGSMTITLYTSLDRIFSTDDQAFFTTKVSGALAAGKLKSFKLNFAYPKTVADGKYFILADVNSGADPIPEINFNNNTAVSNAVKITAPFVDLAGSFQSPPKSLKAGSSATIDLAIANHGTAPATGDVDVELFATPHRSAASNEPRIFTTTVPTGIKQGNSKTLKLKFTLAPGLVPPGSDFLYAVLTYLGTPADKFLQNNSFFSSAPVAFS